MIRWPALAALILAGCSGASATIEAQAADGPSARCIRDDSKFENINGQNHFVYIIRNTCAQRFTCTVNVNVSTELGAKANRAIMQLPKAQPGRSSERSRAFPVKGVTHSIQAGKMCHAV